MDFITFGTKTRLRVPVLQKMMNAEMMMNEAVRSSLSTKLTAAPNTHMIVTL